MRHGRSVANEQGRIASSMATAGHDFGLTDAGRSQVRASLSEALPWLRRPVAIVSSPLLRARETAAIAGEVFEAGVRVDHRLIERGFGDLELGSDDRYASVWELDRRDPTHRTWEVESVVDVWARLSQLLDELRDHPPARAAPGSSVLLVSHGDVASALLCGAQGEPLSRHREVGALATGELRAIDWPRLL